MPDGSDALRHCLDYNPTTHSFPSPPANGGGEVLIPLRLTQSDLASLVGASRVRVNQVLVSYKRRKYIAVDRSYRITMRNRAALAQRCQ